MIISRLFFAPLVLFRRALSLVPALLTVAIIGPVMAALPAAAAASDRPAQTDTPSRQLVMVEQRGCEWCKRWNAEIAPIYPKTREGRFAPLRREDLHALPDDLVLARRVTFTPTFLLIEDSHELARLEGYPGEDFFWPLIAELMRRHLGFTPEAEAAAKS
ncbi:hypothetical protein [Pseudophaeobacter profundi]|uniref:hypothetical protein n=1 Tax=Pseudophaeobacter profundi TaxID=3034152 RepID=UPI00242E1FF6|nr:hypothetical protein [Pseudophaeobacter profundi]